MVDSDLIRVDLLRIKRKLYISFPEGSKERNDFMLAAKMSELSYLQRLVTPETADNVFEEYFRALKTELFSILFNMCLGGSISITLFAFHQLHRDNFWYSLWYLPFMLGLIHAGRHVYHIFLNWKKLQPFKKEYAVLRDRIANVLTEIRKLTGHE